MFVHCKLMNRIDSHVYRLLARSTKAWHEHMCGTVTLCEADCRIDTVTVPVVVLSVSLQIRTSRIGSTVVNRAMGCGYRGTMTDTRLVLVGRSPPVASELPSDYKQRTDR